MEEELRKESARLAEARCELEEQQNVQERLRTMIATAKRSYKEAFGQGQINAGIKAEKLHDDEMRRYGR